MLLRKLLMSTGGSRWQRRSIPPLPDDSNWVHGYRPDVLLKQRRSKVVWVKILHIVRKNIDEVQRFVAYSPHPLFKRHITPRLAPICSLNRHTAPPAHPPAGQNLGISGPPPKVCLDLPMLLKKLRVSRNYCKCYNRASSACTTLSK